jgi:hypothetical protein
MLTQDLGWAEEDWSFTCMGYTDMMQDLANATGTCTLAAAGKAAA